MKTNEEILIAYAQNRIDNREVTRQISEACELFWQADTDIISVVNTLRLEYYDSVDCEYNDQSGWSGWNEILQEEHKQIRDLGDLFDRKREIKNEAGKIKTAIAARGRKLLRDQANENT